MSEARRSRTSPVLLKRDVRVFFSSMYCMPNANPNAVGFRSRLARHAVPVYFVMTFAISWGSAFVVVVPHLLRHESVPKFSGLMMFPAMLLGPCLAGIGLTYLIDGRSGLRELSSRIFSLRLRKRWLWALLLPPSMILLVLLCLRAFVSPVYAPNFFALGIGFGLPAGIFEEIGWMGFAFPRMRWPDSTLGRAVLLGVLWSAWHIPVIDYLGTATPHGSYWLQYFLAFAAAMTAMRVLIAWVYSNTRSVLLAQFLHACSTGSLVFLSPFRVSAAQEAFWYAVYAGVLWAVVAIVAGKYGDELRSIGAAPVALPLLDA